MKTMKLKGKDYVQVVERLKYFKENHKDGRIVTSYELIGERVFFKTEIYIDDTLKATGSAMKDIKSEFNFEKCETRSLGRALGIFGIGSDNSISSYDEVREATHADISEPPKPKKKPSPKKAPKTDKYQQAIEERTQDCQSDEAWKSAYDVLSASDWFIDKTHRPIFTALYQIWQSEQNFNNQTGE